LGGLFCFFLASHAAARGAQPSVQATAGFVYVPGESGEVGCLPPGVVDSALLSVTERVLDEVGLDPDFVVMLTAGVLTCPSIFYRSVKNDISGIGYARQREEGEFFDDAPGRRLQGIAFLNDLPYWQDEPDEFETAFLHELGHRWLARAHATVDGEDVDLTGRDGDHWSYFLDSGGSPLEGNVWLDIEDGEARTDTPMFPKHYSALDLYLMGATAADEVPPLRLFVPDDSQLEDCRGGPLGPASPPQTCGSLSLPGTFVPVEIADVIAAEGPRIPTSADAPKAFTVAFLLLDPGDADFDAERCEELSGWTERLTELFREATDGQLELENAVLSGTPCDELALAEPPPTASGCTVGGAPGRALGTRSPSWPLALVGLVLAGLTRRRANLPG
jgi:hypothetical protein